MVKKACCQANAELGLLDAAKAAAIIPGMRRGGRGPVAGPVPRGRAAGRGGHLDEHERERGDRQPGHRDPRRQARRSIRIVHPIEHVNLNQSTNDTYPTALKVSAISRLRGLSEAIAGLQGAFQDREKAVRRHRDARQDRAAGGGPDHAGRGVLWLCRGDEPRPVADLQVRGAPARGEHRRDGGGHGPERAPQLHLPRDRAPARGHRPGAGARGKPRGPDGECRHVRRGLRPS